MDTSLPISRRQAITLGAAPLLYTSAASRAFARLTPPPQFQRSLAIPPVLQPVRTDDTTDYYEITQREASVEILPGLQTTVWSYQGSFPGPTIKARRGRRTVVRHLNQLKVHTVVHLHGGVTAPDSDGYPTEMVMPGMSGTYTYPNQSRAATLWYHDHAMDHTGRNIYMGLCGMYLIEDEQEASLGLPAGPFDIPLVLLDRAFMTDGSFHFHAGLAGVSGATGDTMLVNGVPWPRLEVGARKYRFRILNGSNSSVYRLALSSGRPLVQIATEGGLLPQPVESPNIPLGMAERIEIVVDFSEYPVGTQVILWNLNGKGPMRDLMRFDVVRREPDDSRVPARLAPVDLLEARLSAHTRKFGFGPRINLRSAAFVWTINGRRFEPDRPLAEVRYGGIETWRISNDTWCSVGMVHSVHVHLVNFLILERNGKPPMPWETGWKDTINLDKGEHARVIMKFDGYRGRYLIHCHNLEHEDHNMMARYDVV